jgi:uncharacterized protein (UPF0332 family)
MKKQEFLSLIKKQGRLKLVEPSEEIKQSYIKKAEDCFKSAKILHENRLYENSVIQSYFCMYNSLLAKLFKIGIKSENHSASIILLKELLNEGELYKIISSAKERRIDKQYYIETSESSKLNEGSSKEMIIKAEEFLLKMKMLLNSMNNDKINNLRKSFQEI